MRLSQPQRDLLAFVYHACQRDDAPSLFVVRLNDRVYLRVSSTQETARFPSGAYTALLTSGYIEEIPPARKGTGTQVSIRPLGLAVVKGDYEHMDPRAQSNKVEISGGTFGNLGFSFKGDVNFIDSSVSQGLPDVAELLKQLVATIDGSDLPEKAKDDAKLEAGQVAFELQKSEKELPEIQRHLGRISALAAGSMPIIELVEKLSATIPKVLGIG